MSTFLDKEGFVFAETKAFLNEEGNAMAEKYYSGVHYQAMTPLFQLTGNHKQAIFLDKILFWFKTSHFNLPRSNDKRVWFTRTYEQMSNETLIPVSTLKRYMQKFESMGFIIRARKKLGINVRAYFTVTEKLLNAAPYKKEKKNFIQNDTPKKTNSKLSIYKDQKDQIINKKTISVIDPLSKKEQNKTNSVIKLLQNIKVKISNPKQLAAEIDFCLDNPFYFKETKSKTHRMNIIKKLITEGKWRTPKGFFNHYQDAIKFKQNKNEKIKSTVATEQKNHIQKEALIKKISNVYGEITSLTRMLEFNPEIQSQLILAKEKRKALLRELAIIKNE